MFVNVPSSISLVSKGMGNWAPQSRNQFQQRAIMRRHISGMGATVCYDGDAGEECYDDGTGSGGGGSSIDIPVYTGDPGTSPAGGGAIQISQNGSFAGGGTYSCTGNTCDLTPAGGGAKTSMTPSQIASLVAVAGQTANGVYRSLQSPYLIPGTSVLYNPANGQIMPSSGAAASLTSILGASTTPLLLMAGAVVLLVLLSGSGGGRR